MSSLHFPRHFARVLVWYDSEPSSWLLKVYSNVIVQAFPPAKIIFLGIGVLLDVSLSKLFPDPVLRSLLILTMYRQRKV